MELPTAVNDQITDSIVDAIPQANVKVLGESPAVVMGQIYQAAAHAVSVRAENALEEQQQALTEAQAATVSAVALLYAVDTAATSVATEKIFDKKQPSSPEAKKP